MKVLGIETSCDETAVAIVDGRKILSSVVASQHDIHSRFGGVVPELASRRHAEIIFSLLNEVFKRSKTSLDKIDGIAVTRAPGLVGALLVGLSTAKAIAFSKNLPLVGVNHLEGHINAAHLMGKEIKFPHIGLIVSGGHTSLYLVEKFGTYKLLGATRDDAAGEAYDKVARLLELGYPGGPIIDRLAPHGDETAIKFKHPKFTNYSEFDFSFSGLKTAVMAECKKASKNGKISKKYLLNIVASFQKTVVDILAKTVVKAAKTYKCGDIVVSGGVSANKGFRNRLITIRDAEKINIHIPAIELCTDNAAMIAFVGALRLEGGYSDDLNLNATAVEEIGT